MLGRLAFTDNGKLKHRYGRGLEIEALSAEQKAFLLDTRVKDKRDDAGEYAVQVTTSDVPEVGLAITDTYSFSNDSGRKNWFKYANRRFDIYKALTGGNRPVNPGAHENRYNLGKSLVSITIEVKDRTKR